MNITQFNQSTVADNAVVASSQPLAVKAGLQMLKNGGNAVDAALATAVALTVVEPTSNGIGSDAFAIVWDGQQLTGLNASGKSPAKLTRNRVKQLGYQAIPEHGWLPVTVPGAPSAWQDLHQRFGKLPLDQIFDPAINYAKDGFEVSPVVAYNWNKSAQRFIDLDDPACQYWAKTFTRDSVAPRAANKWMAPDHAQTLSQMLSQGIDSFYKGDIAKKIIEFSRQTGGYLSAEDLLSHSNLWVDPISVNYRGVDVFELPPNGQGLAALMALALLAKQPPAGQHLDEQRLHHQIEAMKLACVDAYRYITDPSACIGIENALLDDAYLETRTKLITEKAADPVYGTPAHGGTVYLCAADKQGMMVSYIQSNYDGFGSGVVIPNTGIAMQNRGASFSLESDHPNCLEGSKRPFHTIIPGFLMKQGQPLGPFGVMGGFMQPQGHLQVVSAMVDDGLDPQSALDMPRWRVIENKVLEIEKHLNASVIKQLRAHGHEISIPDDVTGFGRGQIILKSDGKYIAGSDRRADGLALGY